MLRFLPQWYECIKNKLCSQMHKAISTKVQSKTCLWQYTIMSIKIFRFSYVFFDFWHKSKKRLIKNNVKTFKVKKKNTHTIINTCWNYNKKHTTKQSHKSIGSINAWTCCNVYACVPFFTHTTLAFRVISLEDWVRSLWLSNLLVKLAKQVVKASIIFSTSLTLGSPSSPFDCSVIQFPLPCLGSLDL